MRVILAAAWIAAGCGSINHDDSKPADAAGVTTHDAPPDAANVPASCVALHTASPDLPSGNYVIDPDGAGGDDPISISCDMKTDGGGWAVVFFSPTAAIEALPITYTAGNTRLMNDAKQALVAYRSLTQDAYANYAHFDLPDDWRTATPFGYPNNDRTLGVSVNSAALQTATLRYGRANFSSLCSDDWITASDYGRLCITGTAAPFYSAFLRPGADNCSDSTQAYNATPCTQDKRFSIAVR